jgi:hypothetical protein
MGLLGQDEEFDGAPAVAALDRRLAGSQRPPGLFGLASPGSRVASAAFCSPSPALKGAT